jgi:pimeloyl-ACP methyl ester carboxylesterase
MSDGNSHPGAGWAARVGRIAAMVARELALPAATVVTAPLSVARGHFQRPEAPAPDVAPAAQAVVLVHGFASAPSCWFTLTRALRAHGVAVTTLDYSPFEASVEQLAERLVTATHRLAEQSGARTVHLVGHSLGGLVIAQALTDERLAGRVDGVVTISSPFGGSPWADLLPLGPIGRQLRVGSPLLRRLAGVPATPAMRWLAFSSTLDVVVPGGRAVPANRPVEHVVITEAGHAGMPLNPLVIERIVNEIVDRPREDWPGDAQPCAA